jgi:hypothetical protein
MAWTVAGISIQLSAISFSSYRALLPHDAHGWSSCQSAGRPQFRNAMLTADG